MKGVYFLIKIAVEGIDCTKLQKVRANGYLHK